MTRHVSIGALSALRRRLPHLLVRGPSQPGEPGWRSPTRRSPRGSEPSRHRRPRPRAGGLRPAPAPDRPSRAPADRARGALDCGVKHRGADVRAGGRPELGSEPADLRRGSGHQPGESGAVRLRAGNGACPEGGVEAPPGAAPRAGGARQCEGVPGHFPEDRPRDVARGAQVRRIRPPTRLLDAGRSAYSRRAGGTRRRRPRRRCTPTSGIWRPISPLAPRRRFAWAGRISSGS